MTTLQEQFEKDFPNKSVGKIDIKDKYKNTNFTNRDLDLRAYSYLISLICSHNDLTSLNLTGLSNLISLICSHNDLTSLNLTGLSNLISLYCSDNKITSVDFLNTLSNPEKLKTLSIFDNNIQPTE